MTNGSDPASPFTVIDLDSCGNERLRQQFQGLTKREWFAGMILQGLTCGHTFGVEDEAYVRCAIRMTDIIIAELSKEVKA